jgi:hypothetical protein
MPTVLRSIRFAVDLFQKIEARAQASDISFNAMVVRLCEKALTDLGF